jgi:hypothetical protein
MVAKTEKTRSGVIVQKYVAYVRGRSRSPGKARCTRSPRMKERTRTAIDAATR